MRKRIIIILQIITLMLLISNHFISIMVNSQEITILSFGIIITSVMLNVILYITIGLQLIIICLLIEKEVKE